MQFKIIFIIIIFNSMKGKKIIFLKNIFLKELVHFLLVKTVSNYNYKNRNSVASPQVVKTYISD